MREKIPGGMVSTRGWVWLVILTVLGTTCWGEDRPLVVGWRPLPPYQWADSTGAPQGLDIAVTRAMAAEAQIKIRFQELPLKRLLWSVQIGTVDIAIAVSPTSERQRYAWFSQPFRTETVSLLVRDTGHSWPRLVRLKDVVGVLRRLGVKLGAYYGDEFDQAMKDPGFRSIVEDAPDDAINVVKLTKGHLDGLLIDPRVGAFLLSTRGTEAPVVRTSLTVVTGAQGWMLSQKTLGMETVQRINAALAKLRASGQLDSLLPLPF